MTLNQLNSILVQGRNGHLFLQTTFFVPRIDYRNAGFKIKPPSKNGITNVEVYINKDKNLPSIEKLVCLNPIIHWIDLGNGYKVSKNGKLNKSIEITVYELISGKKNKEDDKKKVGEGSKDGTDHGGETP